MDFVLRSRRLRLYPSPSQEADLMRMADGRRFAYNWALERLIDPTNSSSASALMSELAAWRRSDPGRWLRAVDSQVLQQATRDAERTVKTWESGRCGRPKFRARKVDRPRFRIPQRVVQREGRLRCPRVGWIRYRGGTQLQDGEPIKTATFARTRAGAWHVSVAVEVPCVSASSAFERPGGIDLGLVDLIVDSEGRQTRAPRSLARAMARVRRSHRSLARKSRGSANRAKARVQLSQVYERVTDQRGDFIHKQTNRLLEDFDLVSVEGLNARGMARTKLARSAQDAAFGEVRRQLKYKSETRPSDVVVVDRFFPSSKRCSACGCVNASLDRRQRSWRCVCGAVHDRDVNAAVNLRDEGMRIRLAAGYADSHNVRGDDSALGIEQSAMKRKPGESRDATSEVLCASPADDHR